MGKYRRRDVVHCCMRKVSATFCSRVIRAKQQRTYANTSIIREGLKGLLGEQLSLSLFNKLAEDDAVCGKCFGQIKKHVPRKPPSSPKRIIQMSPMKLKTGKVIIIQRPEIHNQETEEREIFMPPPDLEDMDRPESRNSGNATTVTWSGETSSRSQNWTNPISQDRGERSDSQPSSINLEDSQTTTTSIADSQLSEVSRTSSSRRSGLVTLPGIRSVPSTQSKCFICSRIGKNHRNRIPKSAWVDLWIKRRILVPAGNRCCMDHLRHGQFTDEAKNEIEDLPRKDAEASPPELAKLINLLADVAVTRYAPLSFDDPHLTDDEYRMLTGLRKNQFDELVDLLKKSGMRNTKRRSVRNALGMTFFLLRVNTSQWVIAFLFGMKHQCRVSSAIKSVIKILHSSFVPKYLGWNHLTRAQIAGHSLPLYYKLLGVPEDTVILVLDGTYLFIQKPSDYFLQHLFWCEMKKHNLVKPMMVILPDGYILHGEGLYGSDGRYNDAEILRDMLKDLNGIKTVLEKDDVVILDRGFQRIVEDLESMGLKVYMPACMEKDQSKFTAKQANNSRRTTKLRGIVERANAQFKNIFHFLDAVIPNGYLKKLESLFQVALATINAFYPPLQKDKEVHEKYVQLILAHDEDEENLLEKRVEDEELAGTLEDWNRADEDSLLGEFPELSDQDLDDITLGVYQLEQGERYNVEHFRVNGRFGYRFHAHKQLPGLIRVKMLSRYCKTVKHLIWIQFEEGGKGREAITGWYCNCKSGSRTLGCCSHVAAVLRYLGKDRYERTKVRPDISSYFKDAGGRVGKNTLDALELAEALAEEESEEEGEASGDEEDDSSDEDD